MTSHCLPSTLPHDLSAQGGWGTLWRGTQPTVIRLGLGAGLHFLILETIKPLFESRQADGSTSISALGAIFTGQCCLVAASARQALPLQRLLAGGGRGGWPASW